ncbi:hypothetical protein DL770_000684 [Monosporascus sp. CRB-9-2]|nr:hypothetical protein DL770_000684 [Monosporascus sp. CRB-9-2]
MFRNGLIVLWAAALARICTVNGTSHIREIFFVGGEYIETDNGDHVRQGQMYVEHLRPTGSTIQAYPIIFIHGATRTGIDWLTKPDGQPGWADYFLARGYECYLVDLPYQGRSPSPPTPPRDLRYFSTEVAAQRFTAPKDFGLWTQAALHTRWPGAGHMGDPVFDQFFASGNYLIDNTTFQQTTARATVSALVDRIGRPVVLLAHSNGGAVLWLAADARPGLVKALVAIEPLGPPFKADFPTVEDARPYGLTDIPIAYDPPIADPAVDLVKDLHVSNSTDLANCTLQAESARRLANLIDLPVLVVTGQASYHARYDWCSVEFLKQAAVDAEHLQLEAANITGNGHFMFMETNSDSIASQIAKWLAKVLTSRHSTDTLT